MRTWIGLAIAMSATTAFAQTDAPPKEPNRKELPVKRIELMEAESHRFISEKRIRRVDGHDPDIIDIQPIGPSELRFLAKAIGTTQVTTLDEDEKLHTIQVTVRPSTRDLEATLRKLYPNLEYQLVPVRADVLVLRGQAESDNQRKQVVAVCETFFPKVLNQMKLSGDVPVAIPPGLRVVKVKIDTQPDGNPAIMGKPQIKRAIGKIARIQSITGNAVAENVRIYSVGSNWDSQPAMDVGVLATPEQAERLVAATSTFGLFEASPTTQGSHLHQQVRDLHQDVRKLIKLLEKRGARADKKASPKQPGKSGSDPTVPKFDASGDGPSARLNHRHIDRERIQVEKFAYNSDEQRRFEVVVFKDPEDRQRDYIRRLELPPHSSSSIENRANRTSLWPGS